MAASQEDQRARQSPAKHAPPSLHSSCSSQTQVATRSREEKQGQSYTACDAFLEIASPGAPNSEVIGQPREPSCVLGGGVVRAGQVVVGAVAHTNERTGPHTITRGAVTRVLHYLSTPPSGGRCITPTLSICYMWTGQGRRTKSKAFGRRTGPEGSTTRRRGEAVADADSGWPDLVFSSLPLCTAQTPDPFGLPFYRSYTRVAAFCSPGLHPDKAARTQVRAPFAPHAVIGCLVVSYQILTALWMSPSLRGTSGCCLA